MISALLRAFHAPVWLVFAIVYGGYTLMVFWTMVNGYTRELTGWKHAGRPSKMHKVFMKWHTGLPVNLTRTTGDERHLRRTAGNVSRATPEGMIIMFARWPRWARTIRNNTITALWLLWSCGMALDPAVTLQTGTVVILLLLSLVIALWVRKLRRAYKGSPRFWAVAKRIRHESRKMPIPVRATRALDGSSLEAPDDLHVLREAPKLSTGVSSSIMASLLAEPLGVSPAEVMTLLSTDPDHGECRLPDRFASLQKQRDVIEEIIKIHNSSDMRFTWHVTEQPRKVEWVPIKTGLPSRVLFRDFLAEIGRCKRGEQAVGLTAEGKVYITSHNAERPWHCRCAGSGTGKSTGYLVKAAQILHNDPRAQCYCVDTKQVSFEALKGVPRCHVFDDPEGSMGDIWDVFYSLEEEMRKRYTAKRKGEIELADLSDIWLLVDEGNDLATQLKSYYKAVIKKAGDPAAPVIWEQAVASLINLGRQVGIRGEFMLQNITDRALGGVSLRDSFSVYGMADYTKNQWQRIIGTAYVEPLTGPGRICMVRGTDQTWVQGFYDEEKFLRRYAMSGQ